ncbi:MAG: hypothetical protein WC880_02535 [Candidatus Paceibacterota bacterium]
MEPKRSIDPRWTTILKITPPRADKHKWSLYPRNRILHSFNLEKFSKKVTRDVERYLEESIQVQKVERAFKKRWSPKVYHKNTYRFLDLEEQIMKTILKRLKKVLVQKKSS